ncbi:hypothetical protein [Azospirillum agricola]|uniref:hypothetical protein n=1 Tax=Azospirillum agricola TaxID=1720247 RepID=UPI000A0F35F6|nr:hypothetical protein [Azospirillum agricola]SMH43427.1 hypothetical protein SAMN02982994_1885 [Azospirillum lipoferum]
MTENELAGYPFEELVLFCTRELLRNRWRRDRATNIDAFDLVADRELRIDVLIGVLDCLRLLRLRSGFLGDGNFEAFEEAFRAAWRDNGVLQRMERVDHLWECAKAAMFTLTGKGAKVA